MPGRVIEDRLATLGGLLCGVLIVMYQLGLLSVFFPALSSSSTIWRLAYYGGWTMAVLTAGTTVVTNHQVRQIAVPVGIVCILGMVLASLHPIGNISKNYFVAMAALPITVALAVASSPRHLLYLSASVTVLLALIVLADFAFVDGLSTSAGRAAGIAINPNVSAAFLILSYAATSSFLPRPFRLPFAIIVGFAVLTTLSRTSYLAFGLVLLTQIALEVCKWLRNRRFPALPIKHWVANLILILSLVGWVGVATQLNDRIAVAATSSFAGLGTFQVALQEQIDKIGKLAQRYGAKSGENGIHTLSEQSSAVLAQAAEDTGDSNSAVSRVLLLQRSWNEYRNGSWGGVGLEAAHAFAPHNSYIMFAVAFGHIGWLVPIGFVLMTLLTAGIRRADLTVALASLLFFSHDILLSAAMLVPLGLCIAGARSGETAQGRSIRRELVIVSLCAVSLTLASLLMFRAWHTHEFRTVIEAAEPSQRLGFGYLAPLPRSEFPGIVRLDIDKSKLEENGTVIAERPGPIKDVQELGEGRLAIWSRLTLVYSASDNSNPRTNGREYVLKMPAYLHPLMCVVLALIVVWCAAVVYFALKRHQRITS